MFAPHLATLRRIGLREYGTLAQRYVREFDDKWLRGGAPPGEPLVGSADIQSLADLGNGYQVIKEIRPLPFGKEAVLQLVWPPCCPPLRWPSPCSRSTRSSSGSSRWCCS